MARVVTTQRLVCKACGAKFGYQSSLVRHQRKTCNQSTPLTLRRKSCVECVHKKRRCSLQRPSCERCRRNGTLCSYEGAAPEPDAPPPVPPIHMPESAAFGDPSPLMGYGEHPAILSAVFDNALCYSVDDLDSLTASPDVLSQDLITIPHSVLRQPQHPPQPFVIANSGGLALHSMELILRVLRTYPGMLVDGFGHPPIFHHSQLDARPLPLPLSHCITLTKMWKGQSEGSGKLVHNAVVSEVDSLIRDFPSFDAATQTAALQAMAIYAIIILSPSKGWISGAYVDLSIFLRLRSLVQQVVAKDLFLEERAEQQLSWAAWIDITSKRRAILTLYLLEFACALYQGVSSYDCVDLSPMPAPAAKVLWQATTEDQWNRLYRKWLERWAGQPYMQAEFFRVKPGIAMNARAERWFAEADEFGFIMVGIVNATNTNLEPDYEWN
ncbi:hypothetical protein B0I35DRAFT_275267 [Stachybotrys elegans]|uniref:Zn(2)-C6 fungal-type domain-containing protein n=1 Tax=Stachybotrys elegans TaxID=80388 RepID=A0A8K0WP06_9HYPO|nr:hypothetical protein B0I35DRAFT_275267 [Stachybotrys elegans]